MRFRRTREITIQTTETLSVRIDQDTADITCHKCGAGVAMLTPEALAATFGLSLRGIYRQVEAGRIHYQETRAGRLMICPKSIEDLLQSGHRELCDIMNEENQR